MCSSASSVSCVTSDSSPAIAPSRGIDFAVAIVLLGAAGLSTARILFDVALVDVVMFQVAVYDSISTLPAAGCVLLLLLLLRFNPARLLARIFLPFVLTLPFLCFRPSFHLLIAYTAAVGWTVYRAAICGAFAGGKSRQIYRRLPLLFGLLLAAFLLQGVLISWDAYRSMFLSMADWGIYAQTAHNLWQGSGWINTWPSPSYSAGHFMPGYFLPFALLYGLLPSPLTGFIAGALCLWGSAALLYLFARRRGFSPSYAAAFGLIWLLHPAVTNMNLSIFYGINAMSWFIPLLFGYYLLREAGHRKLAFLLFLYTLTIKETVGIFWAGWGVMAFLEGRKREGVLYAVIGAVWFLLCIKVFMPHFNGEYIFYSQFEQLGGGVIDILLSPLTRPAEFWGQLLRLKNLQFLLLILLPMLPAALYRPWLLGSGFLLLAFHFVRGSEEIVNLCLQYQLETVCIATIAMVLGVRRARRNGWLARALQFRLEGVKPYLNRQALVAGTLACALTSHLLFAESRYGKVGFPALDSCASAEAAMAEVRELVPRGAWVNANGQAAAQLLFRNPSSDLSLENGEYVLYHSGDRLGVGWEYHRSNLADPTLTLIWLRQLPDDRYLYLFRRAGDSAITDGDTSVTTGKSSPPEALQLPAYRARGTLQPPRGAGITVRNERGDSLFRAWRIDAPSGEIRFLLQAVKAMDRPIMIHMYIETANGELYRRRALFGDGAVLPEEIPLRATQEIIFQVPVNTVVTAEPLFAIEYPR